MKKVAEIIGLIVVALGILAGVALILKKYFCKDECCCGCEDDDLDEYEPDDECECEFCCEQEAAEEAAEEPAE